MFTGLSNPVSERNQEGIRPVLNTDSDPEFGSFTTCNDGLFALLRLFLCSYNLKLMIKEGWLQDCPVGISSRWSGYLADVKRPDPTGSSLATIRLHDIKMIS